jgi:mannose-1-phosphate guanylyltransferase
VSDLTDCYGHALAEIDVAILAGGLGTRIRPVLGDLPKFLAPVEGRAYADYLFEWLASYGVRRVVLCLGHLAHHIAEAVERDPPPFEIVFSVEPEPLGTAGALRHARAHLRSDPVLVLNGDSFVRADLGEFLAKHRMGGAAATLLCTEVPDTDRFGKVELGTGGGILGFSEKRPDDTGPGTVNAGIYLMNRIFLDEIATGTARSLEREIFAEQPAGRLMAYSGVFPFIDIGTPDDLADATAARLTPNMTGRHS